MEGVDEREGVCVSVEVCDIEADSETLSDGVCVKVSVFVCVTDDVNVKEKDFV